jgi:hypothetical protein
MKAKGRAGRRGRGVSGGISLHLRVSGQMHGRAALPSKKYPTLFIKLQVRWPLEPVSTLWDTAEFFALPGIDRRFLDV